MKKYICPEIVCINLLTADIVTVSVGENGKALSLDLDNPNVYGSDPLE